MTTLTVVYRLDEDSKHWNVEIPEVQGCLSFGHSIENARARIREALTLFRDDAQSVKFREVFE